jgi:hypothetical protein
MRAARNVYTDERMDHEIRCGRFRKGIMSWVEYAYRVARISENPNAQAIKFGSESFLQVSPGLRCFETSRIMNDDREAKYKKRSRIVRGLPKVPAPPRVRR